jgi:hypothetical protein
MIHDIIMVHSIYDLAVPIVLLLSCLVFAVWSQRGIYLLYT